MRLLLLFMLLPAIVFAQQKGWQEITISDGLSQGMIYDLEQDPSGFIWVATKDGLNRYDGHNFTVFTHDPYNDFSLSDNACSALLIDRRGRLWVGTLNQGLNLFDDRTRRFYHIDVRDQTAPNAGNYEIKFLAEDPGGNIWVGTNNNKLFKITLPDRLKTGFPDQANFTGQVQSRQLALPATAFVESGQCITFETDGQARLSSTADIYAFNWRQPGLITHQNLPGSPAVGSAYYSVYSDAKQDIWLAATAANIRCWQHGIQKTIPLPKTNYVSVEIKAVDANTLLIATTDLLWVMSPAELMRQDSLTVRNAFVAMPTDLYAITDLLRDQTGMIWVGTSGYGLRKFNPKVRQFRAYLPGTTLGYLYADRQGRTYMRHEFAYGQLNRTTNRLEPFLDAKLPPADKRQRYLMQDRQGIFWVSNVHFETHERHLFKFSADWKLLKKYPLPPETAFGFFGNCTIEDKAGYLWLGATNGQLLRFDPVTEAFRVFSYQSLLPQRGAEIETYTLYFDHADVLWIGTQAGLIRASNLHKNPVFTLYKNAKTNRHSLSNDFVASVLDDPYQPARYLWVGTKGGGLERLDKQMRSGDPGRFDHFTEAQGLPNNVIYGILADEFKNLWLSTNRGLAQFNPKTGKSHNYTKADGLQDDEFNTGSYWKSPSGELLFGGVNGLTAFRASEVIRSTGRRPLANIVGLKINNEVIGVGGTDGILSRSIERTQRIDLTYTQNLLTLEFGVMDYTNPGRNRYRYRLNGLDRDWVEAGTNRFANYAQLPTGDYTFQMIGSSDGDVWSKPVVLYVRVHPPFYRTWWAYLLYALALAALAWQLYRFQMQRLLLQQQIAFEQKEAGRLAELDGLKTQFFTNISHEFRTPLTLLMGPLADLKQRYPAEPVLPMMARNGDRLLSLINQLLDLSKLDAGQLRAVPEPGDIGAFFRTLASSFTSLAESRHITFHFDQNAPELWADFDPDKVEKIVTNLLSNAFKFTPAGNEVRMTIHYAVRRVPAELVLTIEDSGIGIAPANLTHIFERFYQGSVHMVDGQANRSYEGTGIGLALVNELVRMLNGTIDVSSTEGVGTTFTVALPLVAADRPVLAPASVGLPVAGNGARESQTGHLPVADKSHPPTLASANILLIIDDNADIRAYVRSIFEGDYQIIEAVDGQDGLERATASLPDIIICDLMMPRLDGFGFCRALKTQEATSHIPVVMLTAKATVEDRVEGFERGADDYLTKPFNHAEIRARVGNLIQQRQRLYAWFAMRSPAPDVRLMAPSPLTAEQKFIDRLSTIVNEHLDDADFTVEALAEAANLSRVQLHRKLKALTDITATNFIREIRLVKAAELLESGEDSVSQVAYAVGFENLSYFAKVFQERYGVLPSQYGSTQHGPAQTAAHNAAILPIK